jgi:peroxiredoxin Q/BCP
MITLEPGQPAPDFSAPDQNGNLVRLQDFRGRRVALYFYPKDDTPGCTAQACNLRDHQAPLLAAGMQVIGVSVDGEASHQKFALKYELPYPLLLTRTGSSDSSVWQEKEKLRQDVHGHSCAPPFMIDAQGNIEKRHRHPADTKNHAAN